MVDGSDIVVIADNCDDLTNGDIDHAIDHDEFGRSVPSSNVWTGTDRYGYHLSDPYDGIFHNCGCGESSCDGWSTSRDYRGGMVGKNDTAGYRWTEDQRDTCDSYNRLYCFEI